MGFPRVTVDCRVVGSDGLSFTVSVTVASPLLVHGVCVTRLGNRCGWGHETWGTDIGSVTVSFWNEGYKRDPHLTPTIVITDTLMCPGVAVRSGGELLV